MIPYSFATHSANPFIIFVYVPRDLSNITLPDIFCNCRWPITFISITVRQLSAYNTYPYETDIFYLLNSLVGSSSVCMSYNMKVPEANLSRNLFSLPSWTPHKALVIRHMPRANHRHSTLADRLLFPLTHCRPKALMSCRLVLGAVDQRSKYFRLYILSLLFLYPAFPSQLQFIQ